MIRRKMCLQKLMRSYGLDVPQATELVHRMKLKPKKTVLNADECVDYIVSLLED